jgi:ribosome-binding protein aMBF1 (putative translation factor)
VAVRDIRLLEGKTMADRTCAACDCKLEGDPIKVKIGGKTVEVCCEECAAKLKEADTSARARSG